MGDTTGQRADGVHFLDLQELLPALGQGPLRFYSVGDFFQEVVIGRLEISGSIPHDPLERFVPVLNSSPHFVEGRAELPDLSCCVSIHAALKITPLDVIRRFAESLNRTGDIRGNREGQQQTQSDRDKRNRLAGLQGPRRRLYVQSDQHPGQPITDKSC